MIKGNNDLLEDQKGMRERIGTESIWTIDLVSLLHHLLNTKQQQHKSDIANNKRTEPNSINAPLSYVFCSTKFRVEESYNLLGYYKDAYQDDLLRVERLFALAEQERMPLLKVSMMSLNFLVDFVSKKGCVAIVLIDNRVLVSQCSNCNDHILDASDTSTINTYSGHYVILCGISYDSNDVNYAKSHCLEDFVGDENYCMVLKNPGSWKEQEFVSKKRFESAWRANGTDEDAILIHFHC